MKKILFTAALALAFGLTQAQQVKTTTTKKETPSKTMVAKKTEAKSGDKKVEVKKDIVLKKDGTPDKRYKNAKHLKADGTPDMRYKENKKTTVKTTVKK